MGNEHVYYLAGDMVSAFGVGAELCMQALAENRHPFLPVTRFHVPSDRNSLAACFPEELSPSPGEYLSEHVLKILAQLIPSVPDTIPVYFAMTQGETERMEAPENQWTADWLLYRALEILHKKRGRMFSAACASGNLAIAAAAGAIASGAEDAVLVCGCDFVNEFVFSGFSSLNAMSGSICRPFDRDRDGLLLGDAVGFLLLANEKTSNQWHCVPKGHIAGTGVATDAFHIAAPDPNGYMMARAMRSALNGISPDIVGAVIGHGTGTRLNDAMEIAAVKDVFPYGVPLFSVKGCTGHILGASGVVQLILAQHFIEGGLLYPQTNLLHADREAVKYLLKKKRRLAHPRILSLNAGFGGLNAAILLEALP